MGKTTVTLLQCYTFVFQVAKLRLSGEKTMSCE